MIKIIVSHFKLLITGHEISNNRNKLVCCAVSSISLTGVNCFKKEDLNFISRSGFLWIELKSKTIKNKIMWNMLINQLYLLYKGNKKNILWKRKGM